jgi:hypothetical protein
MCQTGEIFLLSALALLGLEWLTQVQAGKITEGQDRGLDGTQDAGLREANLYSLLANNIPYHFPTFTPFLLHHLSVGIL